jgi:hypothetical protein
MAITGVLDENLILQMFETRQFSMVQLKRELSEEELQAEQYSRPRRSGSSSYNMRVAIGKFYEKDKKMSSGIYYRARQ